MPALEYPGPRAPANATGVEITHGIYWLRLPLPFALDHINVWLLDDGDHWTLVDTGIGVEATRTAWRQLDEELLLDKPVGRIIVTHHHPDHFGLAKWHADRFGCPVHASNAAIAKVRYLLREDIADIEEPVARFYRSHGVAEPGQFVEFDTGRRYCRVVAGLPDDIVTIADDRQISIGGRHWRTILSDGHAEGHVSLHCPELDMLISGDQILPAISSNVSLYAHSADADPLHDYLNSLERFGLFPESTLVLPSHGRIFHGLQARIRELQAGHADKLDRVVALCREPVSAAEIVELLFTRKLDDLNRILAYGETLAHLRYLERQQRLQCTRRQGITFFQLPG